MAIPPKNSIFALKLVIPKLNANINVYSVYFEYIPYLFAQSLQTIRKI